jgi:hypothetical protein
MTRPTLAPPAARAAGTATEAAKPPAAIDSPPNGATVIWFNLHFLLVQSCNIVSERFFDDFSEMTSLKHRFFMFLQFVRP